MKKLGIFNDIVCPISIALLIPIIYIFINDRISGLNELESCEGYSIDIIPLLIFYIVIVFIISCYYVTIGNKIIKYIKNNFLANTLNAITFATIFTFTLVCINLFQTKKKIEWDFFIVIYPALLLFGIYVLVFIKLKEKVCRISRK